MDNLIHELRVDTDSVSIPTTSYAWLIRRNTVLDMIFAASMAEKKSYLLEDVVEIAKTAMHEYPISVTIKEEEPC